MNASSAKVLHIRARHWWLSIGFPQDSRLFRELELIDNFFHSRITKMQRRSSVRLFTSQKIEVHFYDSRLIRSESRAHGVKLNFFLFITFTNYNVRQLQIWRLKVVFGFWVVFGCWNCKLKWKRRRIAGLKQKTLKRVYELSYRPGHENIIKNI